MLSDLPRLVTGLCNRRDKAMTVPAFICSITGDVFKDPVVTSDGHTYERADIVGWLRRSETSPLTNVRLASKQLLPNHALKRAIEECTHEDEQRLEREKQALARRVEPVQVKPRGQGRVKVGMSAWLTS